MNLDVAMKAIKANIPEVEEPVWVDLLPIIQKTTPKAKYFPEENLIVVADNCNWIMGLLDGLGYACDNEIFGPKPTTAEGMLIVYDPDNHSNKGYLVITKEAVEKCLA